MDTKNVCQIDGGITRKMISFSLLVLFKWYTLLAQIRQIRVPPRQNNKTMCIIRAAECVIYAMHGTIVISHLFTNYIWTLLEVFVYLIKLNNQ